MKLEVVNKGQDMERLNDREEAEVWLFRTMLDQVVTVGDMFPPEDEAPSMVVVNPIVPKLAGGAACKLVYAPV